MPKLAVIILTKNEERHIADCIKSAAVADEVLVVDSGSTDRTEEIASSQGAKFVTHPMGEEGFAGQRNFALTQTDAEWVFYLDADERILPETAEEIRHVVERGEQAAYRVKRMNIVFGQMMRYGEHGPDRVTRLFPRDAVHWEGVVHESPCFSLPEKELHGTLHHFTYDDWDRYFDKFNQYTSLMAQKMAEKGKRISFIGIFSHSIFAFLRFYIIKLGFLDGKQGFLFAVNHGFYTMVKYIKLYYREREAG